MFTHDRAAILSIGDELTLGQKLDTNSQWLAQRLVDRGITVIEHATIADDLEQNVRAFRRLAALAPLVISTGGLGPTEDDLTRQALAGLLGEALVEDEGALAALSALMSARGRAVSPAQRSQALRPAGARCLPNPLGTAPGLAGVALVDGARADVFCLPGPPGEMRPMFEAHVVPALRPPPGRAVRTRAIHTLGLGEGDLAARLGPLMDRMRSPLVGTTASGGVVTCRVRYEGPEGGADQAMRDTEALVRRAAEPFAFGAGDDTIERVVLDRLRDRGERLVLAESCTGGMLGMMLTGVPGSSGALDGGWITYANEMKTGALGVDPALIDRHGAVSAEVAREMAARARARAPHTNSATHAIAISGVAGPGGGTPDKPVGTVFIAIAGPAHPGHDEVDTRRFLITGDRHAIRDRACRLALAMLRFRLIGPPVLRLLWQMNLDGSAPAPGAAPR